jgi:predicted flap endonuclease-1-like 5' DNA nuclease
MGQDKLIKMINRLRLNVEEQSQIINDFSKERKQYLHKIKTLQETLGGGTNTSPVHAEKSQPSDNLKQINGIGNMTEETLNDFGIYSYAQLASISNDNKALLSQVISSTPDKITIWAQEAQKLLEKE